MLLIGGDGFCGWPTALHLSHRGHDVHILDNFARRAMDRELGVSSLTPIASLDERVAAWGALSGKTLGHTRVDVARDYAGLVTALKAFGPDAVVHLAEYKSAPYSMRSPWHKRSTVEHNVAATHNVVCATVESGLDLHLVHLGTMGVYGYQTGGASLPEGYLTVQVEADGGPERREILHPTDPGSVYHMTKAIDQLLFAYYSKNDRVRVTDLHQGIVWGTHTVETRGDERLVNRFDYDGDFGTVLNRFLVQAAIGHPLTVHGSGGQTRAFIHIQDCVRCIELALLHPPRAGERVRILNQMTETHRVRDLAALISRLAGAPIQYLDNPRNEAAENDLRARHESLIELGLEPTRLETGLLEEIMSVARRYAHRCDPSTIVSRVRWRP